MLNPQGSKGGWKSKGGGGIISREKGWNGGGGGLWGIQANVIVSLKL